MLGFLLARAGVDVVVLEKHADFLRDFRGDTIHPSTLEILYELGIHASVQIVHGPGFSFSYDSLDHAVDSIREHLILPETASNDAVLRDELDRLGLPRVHVHGLRHTATTFLVSMGVPLKDIATMLGHTNEAITLRVYVHSLPGVEEEAVERMAALLKEG